LVTAANSFHEKAGERQGFSIIFVRPVVFTTLEMVEGEFGKLSTAKPAALIVLPASLDNAYP
jgi:hypothetical protein